MSVTCVQKMGGSVGVTVKPVSFVKPIGENYSIGARDARVNDFSNAVRAAFSK